MYIRRYFRYCIALIVIIGKLRVSGDSFQFFTYKFGKIAAVLMNILCVFNFKRGKLARLCSENEENKRKYITAARKKEKGKKIEKGKGKRKKIFLHLCDMYISIT